MVFVKFHNMKHEKNSNVAFKLKQTHKFSLNIKSKRYNHSSQMFSFLFFFFPVYELSISLKMFVLFQYYNHSSQMYSFLFFLLFNLCTVYFTKKIPFFLSCFSICCVQQYSSFFSFFTSALFPLSCTFFVFALFFVFLFFLYFFIINCSFTVPFFPTLYLPLSVFTLTQ